MTLQEFFRYLGDNPAYILFFFGMLPATALLSGILGKGEGHLSPWKYLYATLVYLACVPGIFAVTLNIYLFLFERRSVMEMDIYSQILPVLSMVLTLFLIKNNVSLDKVPGFGKLSGLIMMITATLGLMWILDRTRIWVISFVRFEVVILIFVVLLVLVRLGWAAFFGGKAKAS